LRHGALADSEIAAADSNDSTAAGDKKNFGEVVLTLALRTTLELPTRRGVWLG
jgi:hypothetical protein